MKALRFLMILMLSASVVVSCKSWSNTAKGAAGGTAAGAAVGAGIGTLAGNTAKGAILGAVIGGAAGTAIGVYMDKQARELEEDLEGATVTRVGEGIQITFDSGILFDFDSYQLTPDAKSNIQNMAETLQKYDDTNILIEGHTDDKGSNSYNQSLSERRAKAVADYAVSLGVQRNRIMTKGYGEEQPVADNSSEAGRAENRRVEVAIFANEELKEAAEDGRLK